MHNALQRKVFDVIDNTIGFFESTFKETYTYKYAIASIEVGQDLLSPILIKYRVIGSRKILEEKAAELNKTNLFASFRPDHAQMIVSIATAESLLHATPSETRDSLLRYVTICSSKF